jgi:hypothetical protein
MDYKEWITNRIDEIAEETFGDQYNNLPDETRYSIFKQACEDWGNHESARYEAELEETDSRYS